MNQPIDTISQIRDIELTYRYLRQDESRAELRGLLTSIRVHGKIIFVMLRDVTGVIQVIFQRDTFSTETWNEIRVLQKLDRIQIHGFTGYSKSGELSIFADKINVLLKKDAVANVIAIEEKDSRALTAQFMLARLRERAGKWMQDNGYIEFVPYYLTSSRVSSHLEPLQVIFPGWGASARLTVSPANQLLRALTAANTKVFCFSRIFSQMVRDGYTSAESLILFAERFEPAEHEMERVGEAIIKWVFRSLLTMPDKVLEEWIRSDDNWQIQSLDFINENPSLIKLKFPVIQSCTETKNPYQQELNMKNQVKSFFRIVWPENVVLVEGHIGRVESIKFGGVIIHLERMLPLLKDVPLRFIRQDNPLSR